MRQLRDFEGVWSLHRVIEGETMAGTLTGIAEFWREGPDLIYREAGRLSLDTGGAFEATREYLWTQDGHRIAVRFRDGRAFHDFLPGDGAVATHLCEPDTYVVRYDWAAWPTWSSLWSVRGPQKDYRMLSRYARRS